MLAAPFAITKGSHFNVSLFVAALLTSRVYFLVEFIIFAFSVCYPQKQKIHGNTCAKFISLE